MSHCVVRRRAQGFVWAGLLAAAVSCRNERSAPEQHVTRPEATPISGHQALDRMDQRAPVPLLPMMAAHQKQNMREHLEAVQKISAALSLGDFAAVKLAAEQLGSSQQMTRMCEHMGAHAPGFTELALSFHETADTIAESAVRQDRDAVLAALTRTLAACTSCHSSYKQQVVDDATWAALSARTNYGDSGSGAGSRSGHR